MPVASDATVTVRRIRPDEGPTLARLRLAALTDTPSAFGATPADEAARSAPEWAERAALGAEGPDRATLFAERAGEVIGLAGGYRADPDEPAVDLVSMWTAPSARRAGVGRQLVAAVVCWAEDSGADAVELWVTRGNDPAQRLYETCGFAVTGDVRARAGDPCGAEIRMRRKLC